MQEFRCQQCNRLLGKYRQCNTLEIKCPRCGKLNYIVLKGKSRCLNE
ncbi:MAG: Com family DNA-binding transcriptional regulator [Syntrophomonas sp.]